MKILLLSDKQIKLLRQFVKGYSKGSDVFNMKELNSIDFKEETLLNYDQAEALYEIVDYKIDLLGWHGVEGKLLIPILKQLQQ